MLGYRPNKRQKQTTSRALQSQRHAWMDRLTAEAAQEVLTSTSLPLSYGVVGCAGPVGWHSGSFSLHCCHRQYPFLLQVLVPGVGCYVLHHHCKLCGDVRQCLDNCQECQGSCRWKRLLPKPNSADTAASKEICIGVTLKLYLVFASFCQCLCEEMHS